jgi:sulfate/thiosulfate-binding protein
MSIDPAREFVAKVYRSAPALEAGAGAAPIDFTRRGIGDVLLTWENEAMPAGRKNGNGQFEIVRPSERILAETPVTLVDRTVDTSGTLGAAEAYLNFLYSGIGQELVVEYYFRPRPARVAAQQVDEIPPLRLFTVVENFGGWARRKVNTSLTVAYSTGGTRQAERF